MFVNQSIFTWFSTWWSKAWSPLICSHQLIHSARGLKWSQPNQPPLVKGLISPLGWTQDLTRWDEDPKRKKHVCCCWWEDVAGWERDVLSFFFSFLFYFCFPPSTRRLSFVGIEVISVDFFCGFLSAVTPPIWPVCSTVVDVLSTHCPRGWCWTG